MFFAQKTQKLLQMSPCLGSPHLLKKIENNFLFLFYRFKKKFHTYVS